MGGLFGAWPTFGDGQKRHFHPRLVLGRHGLQMVGGDERTETNHIFLVDMDGLDRTGNMLTLRKT
ncbi:MAG: hypothetical protein KGZ25_10720 [Planctomycetes bacterium]|nr:hypothetical protein [Planctomycetota bacterium]